MTTEELMGRTYIVIFTIELWQEGDEPTFYTALTEERANQLGNEMIVRHMSDRLDRDVSEKEVLEWTEEGRIGFCLHKCHALNQGMVVVSDDKRNLEEY